MKHSFAKLSNVDCAQQSANWLRVRSRLPSMSLCGVISTDNDLGQSYNWVLIALCAGLANSVGHK